jgi:16S rRNA (uracil1498-N3)-methyltransferase
MKVGEEIHLQDTTGSRFVVRIDTVHKRSLVVTPLRTAPVPPPPTRHVTLLQAYIAEQKLDLIIQKATELGAAQVVVWQAEHSPHEIAPERMAHKHERFVAIMRNACEQSGRPDVPTLSFVSSLAEALARASSNICMLEAGGTDTAPTNTSLSLIVGPEGGFSSDEYALCTENKVGKISLGSYTLRAETAAIAGLAKALT